MFQIEMSVSSCIFVCTLLLHNTDLQSYIALKQCYLQLTNEFLKESFFRVINALFFISAMHRFIMTSRNDSSQKNSVPEG